MNALGFIKKQMSILKINYEFLEWTQKPVKYPYFVGEITSDPITTEDGLQESTLILTGFNRGKYIDLEAVREKIEKHFHPNYGVRGKTNDGMVVVLYDNAFSIPTGEADLKEIQINLKIKEWKVY